MPTILPPGGEVSWPDDEGVLGVIGVAPWATVEFLRALYSLVPATRDWHYPRVITDLNTKLPSRGRHFQLGERDPSAFISQSIRELAGMGATAVVLPCNTAHLLYDRWAADTPVPIPHIVKETVALAARHEASLVSALTSSSLASFDLYGAEIERQGMACHRVSNDDQVLISAALEEVKVHGQLCAASLERLDDMWIRLRAAGVDTVLLGCTELSVLIPHCTRHDLAAFDSNQALAQSALRLVMPVRQ